MITLHDSKGRQIICDLKNRIAIAYVDENHNTSKRIVPIENITFTELDYEVVQLIEEENSRISKLDFLKQLKNWEL